MVAAAPPTDLDLVRAAQRLGDVLRRRGVRLATAESATGGLIGHLVTQIVGASDYYVGGVVAYADDVKRSLLDVPADLIDARGAVSAEVAEAMASGALDRLAADVAVAVTGIAGPDGGSKAKPVGLTFLAVAERGRGHAVVTRRVWAHDRDGNKRASALAAMRLASGSADGDGT
ncbi:MAG: CinA family protein [Candidatus Limnocylindria bacterium]